MSNILSFSVSVFSHFCVFPSIPPPHRKLSLSVSCLHSGFSVHYWDWAPFPPSPFLWMSAFLSLLPLLSSAGNVFCTFPSLAHYSPASDYLECALMTVSECSDIIAIGNRCSHTFKVGLLAQSQGCHKIDVACVVFIIAVVFLLGP